MTRGSNWGVLFAPFLCLIFAGCASLPDDPEFKNESATVSVTWGGPAGAGKVVIACPVPPIVQTQKPNRR